MADPYTSVTSFDNIIGNPLTMQYNLSDEEMRRIREETELWRFYKGKQWKKNRPPGEPQNTLNYCRAFVDKGVSFLFGKGFNIKTKSEALNITKPLLDEVWEDNNKGLISLDIGQAGGVTGNAWVKVAIEEFDPEERPDRYEEYPKGRIRIIVMPTYSVFPTWDGHDREKMIRCRIIYPIYLEQQKSDGSIERTRVWYKEEITPKIIREYINADLIDERENSLGEIPVVRIKNLPVSGEPLGISDLTDIIPLQKELNSKTTDVSDIINYHAAPITIIFGAKASNLEKGARKIWGGLPKDAKVQNLELQTDLAASINYLNIIKNSMFELAKMPEDAFGKKMNISNTSGVALHIRNQPLIELTRTKWITYGEGIKQINRLILKYAKLIEHPSFDLEGFEALKPSQKYWTEIEFPNPLPKDELIEMQLIAQKIKLLLLSRKKALMELGVTEADKELDEILAEAQRIENLLINAQGGVEEAQNTNIGGIVNKDDKADDGVE